MPIHANFPFKNLKLKKIIYEIIESEYSRFINIDPFTAELRVKQSFLDTNLPNNIELQIKVFLALKI